MEPKKLSDHVLARVRELSSLIEHQRSVLAVLEQLLMREVEADTGVSLADSHWHLNIDTGVLEPAPQPQPQEQAQSQAPEPDTTPAATAAPSTA